MHLFRIINLPLILILTVYYYITGINFYFKTMHNPIQSAIIVFTGDYCFVDTEKRAQINQIGYLYHFYQTLRERERERERESVGVSIGL